MSVDVSVVIGCPGAGKSTFLAGIAKSLPSNNTLILSYSRSAAQSIAMKAGKDYKASTIHSLCFQSLGIVSQQMLRGKQVAEFCNQINVPPPNDGFDKYDPFMHRFDVYSWARTTGTSPLEAYFNFSDVVDFTFNEYVFFVKSLMKYKEVYGGFEFHDLLDSYNPISAPENILIDESQDNSYSLTMAIEKLIGAGVKRVWMVGDPNQAIYTYSGADPKYMHHFGGEVTYLDQSYRCPSAVVEKAKTLLDAKFNSTKEDGVVARATEIPDDFDMILVRTNYLKYKLAARTGIDIRKISTIHKAKGMQADHVVLYNATTRKIRTSTEIDPIAERRVLYTAVTRTRSKLTIVDGGFPNDEL